MYSKKSLAKSGVKRKAEDTLSDNSSSDLETIEISDEESEDEPDVECDGWDRNCKVVEINIKTNKITGFHLMPTCLPKPKITEDKQATIRKCLKENLEAKFKEHWNSDQSIVNESFEIITSPWKACLINGLLEDDSILKDIRQEFYELTWNRRKIDLYDSHHSLDLKHLHSQKNIELIYNFLKHDVMNFVAELMGLELTHISATCSFYTDTDYLLVHDDRRDDRVVAFILYLSDVYDWEESWGGALQLFNCDDNYQPQHAERNIFPKNNQLVLFPVSTVSYHQVDEVTIKNFSRYSINGWFHGKVPTSKINPICPPFTGLYANTFISSKICDINLNEYINEMYLMQENIKDIQNQIEEFSEISLPDYFKTEFYEKVSDVLLRDELKWKFVGPPNRIRYEVLDSNETDVLKTLIEVFQSQVMFKLLECYTEFEYSGKDAGMKYEVQRWTPGCYSLLSDYDWNSKQELDVILYFGCKGVVGGQVQYVMQEEEIQHALVTLEHNNNTLNVVFRDSARINCYVSKHTKQTFYALVCTYTENKV